MWSTGIRSGSGCAAKGALQVSELRILGISGSLRAGSMNTALLRAAEKLAPAGMVIEAYDGLRDIPPLDADLNTDQPPPAVADLRHRIGAADGLLLATPEYNYGIPGVLKNALDWASLPTPPARTHVLAGKPIALMGCSPSPFGTVRSQMALRQMFVGTDSRVVVKPELCVFAAFTRFDERGELVDDATQNTLVELLESLRHQIGARTDAPAMAL